MSVGALRATVPSRVLFGPWLHAAAVGMEELQILPYERVRDVLAYICGVRLSVGTRATLVRQAASSLA